MHGLAKFSREVPLDLSEDSSSHGILSCTYARLCACEGHTTIPTERDAVRTFSVEAGRNGAVEITVLKTAVDKDSMTART